MPQPLSQFDGLFEDAADLLFDELGVRTDVVVRIRDGKQIKEYETEAILPPEEITQILDAEGREKRRRKEIMLRGQYREALPAHITGQVDIGSETWEIDEIVSSSPNALRLAIVRHEGVERYAPTRKV